MKQFFSILTICSFLLLAACGTGPAAADKKKGEQNGNKVVKIGIAQFAEHPSLDTAKAGFLQALKDAGYQENVNLQLDMHNAQGDMNNNMTIAQKLVGDRNNLILAIATPATLAVAKVTKRHSRPVHGRNRSCCFQIGSKSGEAGRKRNGHAGYEPGSSKEDDGNDKEIFSRGQKTRSDIQLREQNPVVNMANVKQVMQSGGLDLVEVTVTNSSEVKQAADSLVGRADIIYLPTDNTVISVLTRS
ncbi:ABC transporter substrate-binding protein [Paenibacillus larvae]|uniref:ABC transporter substrate-binding protein n=1 Tax=Paenibacillus larvae TaxID=1464 RepID=UPI00403C44E5